MQILVIAQDDAVSVYKASLLISTAIKLGGVDPKHVYLVNQSQHLRDRLMKALSVPEANFANDITDMNSKIVLGGDTLLAFNQPSVVFCAKASESALKDFAPRDKSSNIVAMTDMANLGSLTETSSEKKLKSSFLCAYVEADIDKVGMLELKGISSSKASAVKKAQNETFDGQLFWDYRYETNAELGSGVGSRGTSIGFKSALARCFHLHNKRNVLDVGCGDLVVFENFPFHDYIGIDYSQVTIETAKKRRPDLDLRWVPDVSKADIETRDVVMNFDVLIHQGRKEEYFELLNFISNSCKDYLLVSGFETPLKQHGKNSMIHFYEPLTKSLRDTGLFDVVVRVGNAHGITLAVAQKNRNFSWLKPFLKIGLSRQQLDALATVNLKIKSGSKPTSRFLSDVALCRPGLAKLADDIIVGSRTANVELFARKGEYIPAMLAEGLKGSFASVEIIPGS